MVRVIESQQEQVLNLSAKQVSEFISKPSSSAHGAERVMMDGNNMNELRELVEFLKANGISEFDVERTDLKMRIKFAGQPAAATAGFGADATAAGGTEVG